MYFSIRKKTKKRAIVDDSDLAAEGELDFSLDSSLNEQAVQAAIEGGTSDFNLEGLQLATVDGVTVIRSFIEEDGKFCLKTQLDLIIQF